MFEDIYNASAIKTASLDLHGGFSVEQAKHAVLTRIKQLHVADYSEFLVITGRGAHVTSKGKRGTLFAKLPEWLQHPEVKHLIKHVKANVGSYQITLNQQSNKLTVPNFADIASGLFAEMVEAIGIDTIKAQAKNKIPSAQGLLGYLHLFGIHVEKDITQTSLLIRAAANGGDPLSQLLLGYMHANGFPGVARKSPELCLEWYSKVAESDTPHTIEAHFRLGYEYITGQGLKQDDAVAIFHLTKAANANHALACLNLGKIYSTGLGAEINDVEANKWLLRSALANVVEAQILLSERYYKGIGMASPNIKQALHWVIQAAKCGDMNCQYLAGKEYLEGKLVDRELSTALYFLDLSAKQGHPGAQTELAFNLLVNIGNTPALMQIGKMWLDKAVESEHPAAIVLLARLHNTGHPVVTQDIPKSERLLIKAMYLGDMMAISMVHKTYLSQLNEDQYECLESWVEIHADKGDKEAIAIRDSLQKKNQSTTIQVSVIEKEPDDIETTTHKVNKSFSGLKPGFLA